MQVANWIVESYNDFSSGDIEPLSAKRINPVQVFLEIQRVAIRYFLFILLWVVRVVVLGCR